MKTLLVIAAVAVPVFSEPPAPMSERPIPVATCFKTGERVSGVHRICYYNCFGSEAAITVGLSDLCPLSIQN